MSKNISLTIFSQLNSNSNSDNHSHPQIDNCDASPYLQIKSVSVEERVNPKEICYALWIYPHAVRACGGQYSADEAHKICQAVKGWDWVLDEKNNHPYCLPQLEELINSITKQSVGGAS